jgi:glycosyltransferase involved in cell wall biosynthesis
MNNSDQPSASPSLDLGVVVPLYNKESTVRRCIEALLAQTVSPRRIIVVDDGSTDGSLHAIDEYRDRITILTQRNAGPSAARNRGIRELDTKWVGFADADNCWHSCRVESVQRMIDLDPTLDWLTGRYRRCEADGTVSVMPPIPQSWNAVGNTLDYFQWIAGGITGVHASETLVARRHILLQTGGFHTGLRCHEITLMYLALAVTSPKVGVVGPATVDVFCDRPDSLYANLRDSPAAMLAFGKGLLSLTNRAGRQRRYIHAKAVDALQTALWLALQEGSLTLSREILLEFGPLLGFAARLKGHLKHACQSLLARSVPVRG